MKKSDLLKIQLEIIGSKEEQPPLAAYAYDMQGRLLGHNQIDEKGDLRFEKKAQGQARIFIGPVAEDGRALTLAELQRVNAVERRVMLGRKEPLLFKIPDTLFPCWFWCFCIIKGRVVIREEQPDGTVKELPVCNSRVTICEVDPWPIILRRIPDFELLKIREDLLNQPQLLPKESIEGIQLASQPTALRTVLADLKYPLRPFWPWFYKKDCFTTVTTDETGNFVAYYTYPCCGDKPDFWFKAEQQIDGVWKTIYAPRLPFGIHWNYSCGTEVVLEVDDPAARPCYPEDTVNTTETTWLHPLAVGGMYLAGKAGTVAVGETGWVRPHGRGSYKSRWINNIGGDVTDAPFGGTLGLRMNWSNDLPKKAITFYRFSYRKKGSGADWAHMTTSVIRHYVRTEPQGSGQPPNVSYPSITLGPTSAGGEHNLFKLRPTDPPDLEPGAPAGTSHYWPVNLVSSSDLYSAYLPTTGLEDGETYEIQVEAFDEDGKKVKPGTAFNFIVTTSWGGGNIDTRTSDASEITDDAFIFDLYIDDRDCLAEIGSPSTSQGTANSCGFLDYVANERVNYGWLADHIGDEARWSYVVAKGSSGNILEIQGEAGGGATITKFPGGLAEKKPIDEIALSGANYSGSIKVETLLGTCTSASFAQHLYVYNTVTNGWRRLGGGARDQSDLESFALTLATP